MDRHKLSPAYMRRFLHYRRRWLGRALPRAAERLSGVSVQRSPPQGSLERELRSLLRSERIDTVIDVGAHEGRYGRLVRRLGFEGRIVGFEPARTSFERLQRRADGDRHWEVHRLALGRESGTLELQQFAESQFNSLLAPRDGVALGGFDTVGSETVEVRRLNEVWSPLIGDGHRILLKIDAQGADLDVLEGAADVLERCAAIQIEVSGVPIYEGSPPLHQTVGYLFDRGFRITGLFPIVHDPRRPAAVVDFDATFVHAPET